MKKRMSILLTATMAVTMLAGVSVSATEYPVTITNYDREITIAQKPEKVLTLCSAWAG